MRSRLPLLIFLSALVAAGAPGFQEPEFSPQEFLQPIKYLSSAGQKLTHEVTLEVRK